ncbi:MAG: ribonuclease HII [Candidatus Kapabacteria bacterium]|nr:ribonuclease HII [Candidatus Kapabacteria bacterium]
MTIVATSDVEQEHWLRGRNVAGVDEAGRGSLAGPVVAAAVVLRSDVPIPGLADSKMLRAERRQELAAVITQLARAHATAFVWSDRIDEVNILQATFDAMHQAVDGVAEGADHLLIDGNRFRKHRLPHTCIIGGDARCVSIAAASILAKVARDTWMVEVAHQRWPMYGFDRHKGYGTEAHRRAITEYGPCEIHRRLFLRKLQ